MPAPIKTRDDINYKKILQNKNTGFPSLQQLEKISGIPAYTDKNYSWYVPKNNLNGYGFYP